MTTAIDLFSGGGGFTEGAEEAGIEVIWAANHWPLAVDVYYRNHRRFKPSCQDLQQANWHHVPSHDILLASPACQGHTPARGKDRPHHDATRSTAWAVVSCAEVHRPEAFVVENVPAFLGWTLFGAWQAAMRALGYSMTHYILDAADFGVPQHRERVFIIGTRSRAAFEYRHQPLPHVPVSSILQWKGQKWSDVEKPGRSPATLARVAAGRRDHGRRFVMPYYGNGSGLTGRSLNRPLGTVTTRDRWAVVDGDLMRMLNVQEYKAAMGFPASYKLPERRDHAIHLLGNAVCPPEVSSILRQLVAA